MVSNIKNLQQEIYNRIVVQMKERIDEDYKNDELDYKEYYVDYALTDNAPVIDDLIDRNRNDTCELLSHWNEYFNNKLTVGNIVELANEPFLATPYVLALVGESNYEKLADEAELYMVSKVIGSWEKVDVEVDFER